MSREVHVRFLEGLGVKFPRPTHPYIWTKEGWLFLCVVIDLFSRQVVGWKIDKQMTRELVLSALRQAYFRRQPGTGLIFHSDRGSQYCSSDFRAQLKAYQMLQSQSRRANCWDNACVESFFHTLKTESIYHEIFETRDQAERVIFEVSTTSGPVALRLV
jgi:putative transposase